MNRTATFFTLLAVGVACAGSITGPEVPLEAPASYTKRLHILPDNRYCTALAVLRGSTSGAWDERATIAQTVANLVAATGSHDACDVIPSLFDGIPSLPVEDERIDWHHALVVTDAVINGEYTIAPPQCARATSFHRAEAPTRQGVPPAPPPYCRVGDLFFTRTASDMPGVPGEGIPQ